jgi:hypothetical protein
MLFARRQNEAGALNCAETPAFVDGLAEMCPI